MSEAAQEIIDLLELEPLDIEGGWYRESWRSKLQAEPGGLGGQYTSPRSLGSLIYYLLTSETVSAMHRLPSDEIFHFYLGDPVEMLQLFPGGEGKLLKLGNNLAGGERPHILVPGGVWQGSRLAEDKHGFALMGTTVTPGFDLEDYTRGDRDELIKQYPDHAGIIDTLAYKF